MIQLTDNGKCIFSFTECTFDTQVYEKISTLLHINVKRRACMYLCSALNQSVLCTLFFNWQFLFNYIALYNNYVK